MAQVIRARFTVHNLKELKESATASANMMLKSPYEFVETVFRGYPAYQMKGKIKDPSPALAKYTMIAYTFGQGEFLYAVGIAARDDYLKAEGAKEVQQIFDTAVIP